MSIGTRHRGVISVGQRSRTAWRGAVCERRARARADARRARSILRRPQQHPAPAECTEHDSLGQCAVSLGAEGTGLDLWSAVTEGAWMAPWRQGGAAPAGAGPPPGALRGFIGTA